MTKLYYYLKNHGKQHNPLLIEFLILYPAIPATYSLYAATYMMVVLTILIVATKVTTVVSYRLFPKAFAYTLTVLIVTTYSTLIFMISNAIFPGHFRILLLPFAFLSMNSIIINRLNHDQFETSLSSCFLEGALYLIQTSFCISVIAILGITNLYSNQSAFAILALAITAFMLNFIKIKLEQIILSKEIDVKTNDDKE